MENATGFVDLSNHTFSDEELEAAPPRRSLRADTWYKFIVQKADSTSWGTGSLVTKLVVAPLDEDNDVVPGLSVWHNITIPLANPNVKDHTAPNTFGFAQQYLIAIEADGCVRFPKRQSDGTYLDADGETVYDGEQMEARCREIRRTVRDTIKAMYANSDEHVRHTFFGLTKKTTYKGKDRIELARLVAEVPEGVEVEYEDFTE